MLFQDGNVAVYEDNLLLKIALPLVSCKKMQLNFELPCAQRARLLVNCVLSLFCRLYLLGELSEDGQVSIMW